MAQSGAIGRKTPVGRSGESGWTPAEQVPEIASALPRGPLLAAGLRRRDAGKAGPSGIDNWLLLPALCLPIRLLFLVESVIERLEALGGDEFRKALQSQRGLRLATMGTMGVQVALLGLGLVALALFFGKRRLLPAAMIGLLILELAFNMAAAGWCSVAGEWAAESTWASAPDQTSLVLVALLIGIPYFAVSKRVRATFVR
jgi:hypothetical protein